MRYDGTVIFVTGGAGFIGSAVVRHLLDHTGAFVVNIDKLTYASNLSSIPQAAGHPRYAFAELDICDKNGLRALFECYRPGAVMNLAAESHVDRSIDGPGEFIFPEIFRNKIEVLHEGIDTAAVKPAPDASFRLPSGRLLTAKDEVVTFAARNLEPLRGYHIFMRALPRIMAKRPNAEIVIIGGHGTSYGAPPSPGTTWKSIFLDEVAARIDMSRVHFCGHLPYQGYLQALQISSAHIYLTYPFTLSWSLLEAMSAGCLVIGSDTAPLRDVLNRAKWNSSTIFRV